MAREGANGLIVDIMWNGHHCGELRFYQFLRFLNESLSSPSLFIYIAAAKAYLIHGDEPPAREER